MTVLGFTPHGHEQRTGSRLPGVGDDAGDPHRRVAERATPGCGGDLCRGPRERGSRRASGPRIDLLAGDDTVVEGNRRRGELLTGLVALPEDQHHVPGSGRGHGLANGGPPIQFGNDGALRGSTGHDGRGDRRGVLRPRVVRGDDGKIRLGESGTHERALSAVTIAPRSPDCDHLARGQRTHRVDHVTDRLRGVGVIHDDGELLARLDGFEPARYRT